MAASCGLHLDKPGQRHRRIYFYISVCSTWMPPPLTAVGRLSTQGLQTGRAASQERYLLSTLISVRSLTLSLPGLNLMNLYALRLWLALASPSEKRTLVKRTGSSLQAIRNVANGHNKASADWAARIENATRAANRRNPVLHIIERHEICAACSRCPFTQQHNRR